MLTNYISLILDLIQFSNFLLQSRSEVLIYYGSLAKIAYIISSYLIRFSWAKTAFHYLWWFSTKFLCRNSNQR